MNNSIKILGAYGAKTTSSAMTCIQVDTNILIDAGNILLGLKENAKDIDHIFLTHSHLDHIADIPFVIDVFFSFRTKTLNIYGTKDTLDNLKTNILNWKIWPDFTAIKLSLSDEMAITLNEMELDTNIQINNTYLKAIKTNHTAGSCGYVIEKNNNAIFFTSDTCSSYKIWEEVNTNPKINAIITDISFPSEYKQLAIDSKHFTLELLNEDIQNNLKRDDVKIFINHLKPSFIPVIKDELKHTYPNLLNGGGILDDGDFINIKSLNIIKNLSADAVNKQHIEQLIEIGHSLTSENNFDLLMEKILLGAKQLSSADGGTLYMLCDDQKSLSFKVVQTDSLNIKMGGTQQEINWPNVQLYKKDGTKNEEQVAALCALNGELINIPDVYEAEGFNFEGTKQFDKGTGYRTTSMLVVPLKNHENDIIGVLQLLNKQDDNGSIIEFTTNDEKIILSMGSQAAVSITNTRLIANLEQLLMEFIKSTADAISEKSKYTGGHINRVAEISTIIANKINDDKTIYKDTHFNEDDLKQIDIAAWMHDIGKITTPEYVVDKATKLETIYDRINEVVAKFEIYKRDIHIQYLENIINSDKNEHHNLKEQYEKQILQIDDDLAFIKLSNQGSEYMNDDMTQRIKNIAKIKIEVNHHKTSIINENELYNLLIKKGTLTQEERMVINNHVVVSYNMLKNLSFPKKLARVPIIAGSHHKTIHKDENGKHGGYGAEEIMHETMSIEDKILAVADVFEAVTASDRPYKKPNSLNQSLKIMSYMVKDNELDKDLVKFFIENKIYEQYANDNLLDEQLDTVDVVIQ
jgi:HD-GYP domain-containing protein (c-di-GMP phosphodiesterase class II)/phosphoribosyl 1,2-cyclic phosphodiesterase